MRWNLPISYLAQASPPSWLARHFLLGWHFIIIVVSLYPFSGWRYNGEGILAFFSYPLPHYQTRLDNILNLLAYLPLGYAWALYFRCRWFAPLLALALGALLSGSLEFTQQFLPSRVASNLDLVYNALGALLGAFAAGIFSKLLIVRGWHVRRHRWFRTGSLADYGLVLLILWFITQLNPAVPLFGVVVQAKGLPEPWISPIDDASLFLRLLEISGVALHLTAICLVLITLLARRVDRVSAVTCLISAALFLKMVTAGVLLKPSEFLAWFNLNVLIGGILAVLLLNIVASFKLRWQAVSAALCLGATQFIEALWPLSEQGNGMINLFRKQFGHLRDLNGLAQTVSDVWPYAASIYLILLAWKSWQRSHWPTVLGQ